MPNDTHMCEPCSLDNHVLWTAWVPNASIQFNASIDQYVDKFAGRRGTLLLASLLRGGPHRPSAPMRRRGRIGHYSFYALSCCCGLCRRDPQGDTSYCSTRRNFLRVTSQVSACSARRTSCAARTSTFRRHKRRIFVWRKKAFLLRPKKKCLLVVHDEIPPRAKPKTSHPVAAGASTCVKKGSRRRPSFPLSNKRVLQEFHFCSLANFEPLSLPELPLCVSL